MEMGGSERTVTRLLTHTDREQFKIHVACLTSGRLSQEMQTMGFPIYPLLEGGIYTKYGLHNILYLRKIIKEHDIALIVTYHEASDFYGLLVSKICGVPVVTNRRDMGFKTKRQHAIAYRLCGRYFNGVVSVCDAVKNAVIAYKWFPKDETFPKITIYNGINLVEYDTQKKEGLTRESIGIGSRGPIIGVVANLRKIKGVVYLIEAASLIVKQYAEAQFVIIGHDMGEKIILDALIKERNLTKNVHFLKHRLDVVDLISLFDVAVLSSLSEGFSNVLLEYMASEKPVVATDVGGNCEAVRHGETGFLVPPGNARALYEAIFLLLKDKEKARQFGMAGRKRVEKLFSLEKMISGYESLFRQFCKK
jgi:glycosyltransferase involved in cell wall biosynthesis